MPGRCPAQRNASARGDEPNWSATSLARPNTSRPAVISLGEGKRESAAPATRSMDRPGGPAPQPARVLPAEDGQRLADMSACTVSGTVACVLIPGSVAS